MSEKTFLHIPISKDLMKRIDDYRFNRRFQARAGSSTLLAGMGSKTKSQTR